MAEKQVGDKLYLELQLHDAETDKTVFAQVYKADGATLGDEIQLTHTANGNFVENAYTMPDEEKITVQYMVRESDGTTASQDHSVEAESYVRDDTPDLAVMNTRLYDLWLWDSNDAAHPTAVTQSGMSIPTLGLEKTFTGDFTNSMVVAKQAS